MSRFMDWTSNLLASSFHFAVINFERQQHFLNGTSLNRAGQELCSAMHHFNTEPLIEHGSLSPSTLTPMQMDY